MYLFLKGNYDKRYRVSLPKGIYKLIVVYMFPRLAVIVIYNLL